MFITIHTGAGVLDSDCDLEDPIYGSALDGIRTIEEVTGEPEVIAAGTDTGIGMVIDLDITQGDVTRTEEICTAIKINVTTTSIIKTITKNETRMLQDKPTGRKLISLRRIKIMSMLIRMEMFTKRRRMDGSKKIKAAGQQIKINKEINQEMLIETKIKVVTEINL